MSPQEFASQSQGEEIQGNQNLTAEERRALEEFNRLFQLSTIGFSTEGNGQFISAMFVSQRCLQAHPEENDGACTVNTGEDSCHFYKEKAKVDTLDIDLAHLEGRILLG